MNINEAKSLFIEKYSTETFQLVDELEDELLFMPWRSHMMKVGAEDLTRFIDSYDRLTAEFKTDPNECSMCSTNYREQVVSLHPRFSTRSSWDFTTHTDGMPYCSVGAASDDFKNFFRLQSGYIDYSFDLLMRSNRSNRSSVSDELWDELFTPTTIKIFDIGEATIDGAIEQSNSIIDNCLFSLSYLQSRTLNVEEKWPSFSRTRRYSFGEAFNQDDVLPMPKGNVNPNLLKYYQKGKSSVDPVHVYLSYYHVLEYFFVTVSDEQLYEKLRRRLNDPRFSVDKNCLDRIIQDTENHKRETDETAMLKNVLEKFVDQEGLIEFIHGYESHLNDKLFTKKPEVIGGSSPISLQMGHVLGNVAKRVKSIRNSLVHSSDRHQRQEIFVPNQENELIIKTETLLVKYLAEQVIISSSEN